MFLRDRDWDLIDYDTQDYPFKDVISFVTTGTHDTILEDLSLDSEVFTREKDQSTPWHKNFYENKNIFLPMYRRFIRRVIRPLFDESIIYQTIPTFRVHLRNNVAVGEFHRDIDYGHSADEINFWLPVTAAYDSNSVQFIPHEGTTHFVSAGVNYGQVLVFNAARLHGNLVNKTAITRVSFDFRAYERSKYKPSDKVSVNSKMKFEIGSYWSELVDVVKK